jgi:hypothetical protein
MACWVLPNLACTAATRSDWRSFRKSRSRLIQAKSNSSWKTTNKTHSPCSQLHARPAETITGLAGGLLPHRFSPYPNTCNPIRCRCYGGNPFCCGCSQTANTVCPHLLFREATLPTDPKIASRESGSSSTSLLESIPAATVVIRSDVLRL